MSQNRLEQVIQEKAQNLGIDDWIGIAETVISVIKECQARRANTPQEIQQQIARGGFVQRVSLRRAFRQRGFNLLEANRLTAEAIDLVRSDETLIVEAFSVAEDVI